jgi:hypothetical protein
MLQNQLTNMGRQISINCIKCQMGRVHLVFVEIINATLHLAFTVDKQQSEISPEMNMSVHFEGTCVAMQYMKHAQACCPQHVLFMKTARKSFKSLFLGLPSAK